MGGDGEVPASTWEREEPAAPPAIAAPTCPRLPLGGGAAEQLPKHYGRQVGAGAGLGTSPPAQAPRPLLGCSGSRAVKRDELLSTRGGRARSAAALN